MNVINFYEYLISMHVFRKAVEGRSIWLLLSCKVRSEVYLGLLIDEFLLETLLVPTNNWQIFLSQFGVRMQTKFK